MAVGVQTSLWHTMAPVKCLRLIISLEYELVPEKVHLMSVEKQRVRVLFLDSEVRRRIDKG